MSKLLALVGMNVGESRFDEGERFDPKDHNLSEKQVRYLTDEGYAEEVADGQRLPAETRAAIEAGVHSEEVHPETERIAVEGGEEQ